MSAKGRKPQQENAFEFHETPAAPVRQLLREVRLPGGRWLEPCAGKGAIIRTVNTLRSDVEWTAVEIQKSMKPALERMQTRTKVEIGNFFKLGEKELGLDLPGRFAVTLGNPPFTLAAHFVLQSLKWSEEVLLLLRINWLGSSRKRRHVFDLAGVPDIFILEERPSFNLNGSTDATDYAWMRWSRAGQRGTVQILRGE